MADCFLGYETPFNVTSVMFRAPLGIPDQELIHPTEFSPTTVKPIIEELPRALVRLRTSPYGPIYEFKATLYSVPVSFPEKFAAVRIHTALFDIIYKYQDQSVEFKVGDLFDEKLKASISETRGLVRYIGEAFESHNTLLEITMDNEEKSLKLSFETRASVPTDDFREVSEATESLFFKLSALGLSNETMRPADIFDKRRRINFLQHIGSTYDPPFSFEFCTDDEITSDADVTVFNSPIKLEGKTVVFFAAFYGSVKKIGSGKLYGTFLRSEYLGEIVVPADADIDHLQRLYGKKFKNALRKRGLVVL